MTQEAAKESATLRVRCPHCGAEFNASSGLMGLTGPCGACTKPFTITEEVIVTEEATGPVGSTFGSAAAAPAEGIRFTSPEHGYSFRLPSAGWEGSFMSGSGVESLTLTHPDLDHLVCLAAAPKSDARFESYWNDFQFCLNDLLSTTIHVDRTERTTIAGQPAIRIQFTGLIEGRSMSCLAFVMRRKGVDFMTIAWCLPGAFLRMRSEFHAVLDSFTFDQPLPAQQVADAMPSGARFASERYGYSFTVPSSDWRRSSREMEQARQTDLQLEHAQLGMIRWQVSESNLDAADVMNEVKRLYSTTLDDFEELGKATETVAGCSALSMESRARHGQMLLAMLTSVFARDGRVYCVTWGGPPEAKSQGSAELRAVLSSFTFGPSPGPGSGPRSVSTAASPAGGETFTSVAYGYRFGVRGMGWVRSTPGQEAAAELDVQIRHPDIGEIQIMAFEAPSHMDFEAIWDKLEEGYRADGLGEFEMGDQTRLVVAGQPGMLAEYSGISRGQRLRFVASVFLREGRWYQLIGFTVPGMFPRLKEEFMHVLKTSSFGDPEPPEELLAVMKKANDDIEAYENRAYGYGFGGLAVGFVLFWMLIGFLKTLLLGVVAFVVIAVVIPSKTDAYGTKVMSSGYQRAIEDAITRYSVPRLMVHKLAEHTYTKLKDYVK